jgi:hypothetical protein
MKFDAEKLLKKGRMHVKASCIEGYYVIDVHYDSEIHRRRPRGITHSKSLYIEDCLEVREFLNQFVIPIILANRTHYHIMIKNKWQLKNTLLDVKGAVSAWAVRAGKL